LNVKNYRDNVIKHRYLGDEKMTEETKQEENGKSEDRPVQYELTISELEALAGVQKVLTRNSKRIQVNIPAGVTTGSAVKLSNAQQITDGRVGDIMIKIIVRSEKPSSEASGTESTGSAGVIEVTDSSFENEVLKAGLPVVVDFWAAWCGPCRMMAPIMEKAAVKYQGKFKFCKIDVDRNPEMAGQYQAMSIPLLIFFKDGQVIDKSLGAIPETQLFSKIEALI
jgi:thioredoxin 1